MLAEARVVVECLSLFLDCSSRFLSVLQQNRAQSRLLCLFYDKESVKYEFVTSNFLSRLSKDGVPAFIAPCFIRVMIFRSDKLFLKTALQVKMRQLDQRNLYRGCQALALIR